MLKVRISGKADDVKSFCEKLDGIDGYEVVSQSKNYISRGGGIRRYIEVEFNEKRLFNFFCSVN